MDGSNILDRLGAVLFVIIFWMALKQVQAIDRDLKVIRDDVDRRLTRLETLLEQKNGTNH